MKSRVLLKLEIRIGRRHESPLVRLETKTYMSLLVTTQKQACSVILAVLVIAACLCPTCLGQPGQLRPVHGDDELKFWLENMVVHHHYTPDEVRQVTGIEPEELQAHLDRFDLNKSADSLGRSELLVLPYPGGRHPRIGFLDGAIEPQRETKLSVFSPWDPTSYVVIDVPEAIWSNLGLTYLAHTHVATVWSKRDIVLKQLEWTREKGAYQLTRVLPNGIKFAVYVSVVDDHLEMAMSLTNGTAEELTDLRVQNCAMLKGMKGFEQQSNDNKYFSGDYATAFSSDRKQWIITGWSPIHRPWGNMNCPCLHADPKFPDCPPGETKWIFGWLSFYDGEKIDEELERIDATDWRKSNRAYQRALR